MQQLWRLGSRVSISERGGASWDGRRRYPTPSVPATVGTVAGHTVQNGFEGSWNEESRNAGPIVLGRTVPNAVTGVAGLLVLRTTAESLQGRPFVWATFHCLRSRPVMATPSVPATPAGRCGDARVSRNGDQRCRDASFWNTGTRWGDSTPTFIIYTFFDG